ncbi:MAG TPA: protein DA1 [Ktedonobacteraceae bacterium]|nr:protein DA1 [Ktedonobacteraceae bacterium]
MQTLTPICKGCGQPIRGNYVNALGADWHPEHLICAACGKPLNIQGFTLHEGQPYHPDCFLQTVASRCAYCGKPLIGEYRVDGWGTTFCKEHLGQFPACEFCGRLVPPTQQEKGAETVRCSICRSSAIESADAARPLFSQVIRWVGSQGLTYNNLRLGLEVCGREHLARLLKQQGHVNSLGATTSATYTQNGRIVRTEINGIAVLWGLPKTLFEGVTVHELGHVWLIVHGITGLPHWAEEGFCELLSYRYYSELNTPEGRFHAQAIERNTDRTYGDGFRRVRALADAHGFARLLETLRTTKRLPSP